MTSRPVRARGLKRSGLRGEHHGAPSRPVRARGLKRRVISTAQEAMERRAPCGRVD